MKAEIVSVGTELLLGQIANTDAQYLSEQLSSLGIDTHYHHVVGDNALRLQKLLKMVMRRCDIIITTGGVGPTMDDLTKETVAEVFGLDMVLDPQSLEDIKGYFKSVHKDMSANNEKQAMFPEGAIILKNKQGTAPGCIVEAQGVSVIILPGPPRELTEMFEKGVLPYLQDKAGYIIKSKKLKFFGIGESSLESQIIDLIEEQDNPTIATYASTGEVMVRVTAKAKDEREADRLLEPVVEAIDERCGQYRYAADGESLAEAVVKKLIDAQCTVSTAESCTGGMLSSMIVDVSGASSVFNESFVTYSNASKIKRLGVPADMIEKFGAVSRQTAEAMARGLYYNSRSDIAIAITGVAGPEGSEAKPAGLIYLCLYDGNVAKVKELNLKRDRNVNRRLTCLHALDMIRKHLDERLN